MDLVEQLAKQIAAASTAYYAGEAAMADAEFDALVERLHQLAPDHAVLRKVGAAPIDGVQHEKRMLSLQKAYTVEDVQAWMDTLPTAEGYRMAPKVDGLAVEVLYDQYGCVRQASTRGDGRVGQDVTTAVSAIPHIAPGPWGGRRCGEVYLPLSTFAQVGGKHPRNVAAGALLAKEAGTVRPEHLRFMEHFADRAPVAMCRQDVLEMVARVADGQHDHYKDVPIDGWVFWHADMDRLGETEHHPKGAIALKLPDKPVQAVVSHTHWDLSGYGTLTPVIILLEPVVVGGASISRVTGHNLSTWLTWGLRRGSVVSIVRRGGVIPHIEAVVSHLPDSRPSNVPNVCWVCLTKLKAVTRNTSTILTCPNESCSGQVARRLERWCKAVGADGFGPSVCEGLVQEGVLDIDMLYAHCYAPGFASTATRRNLATNLRTSKVVAADKLLFGLSLPGFGEASCRNLARAFKLEDLFEVDAATVSAALAGVGSDTARLMLRALHNHLPMLGRILKAGYVEYIDVFAPVRSGVLSGQVVCFTGELSVDRLTACGMVEAAGAVVSQGVTRKTTLLVAADDTPSTKYKRAQELGVRIVNEVGLRQILKEDT